MNESTREIWQFGDFKLDTTRKVLWHQDKTVSMPLKELEVLSMLVANRGELVTKDELLIQIWEDSFVEESNLSRHIYLLRKTFKSLGVDDDVIETVPRRGYRFTGNAREIKLDEIVLEKRTQTRTFIEIEDGVRTEAPVRSFGIRAIVLAALVLVATTGIAIVASRYIGSTPGAGIKSIAVLPFKTVGAGHDDTYSGIGMADILTTRLGNVRELKIRPTSAVLSVGDQDAVSAGERLQVDAVLEGTIYDSNDRVRVTSRLVRVSSGTVVWSGEFEKLKSSAMLLQSDLAAQIASALAINLTTREREALAKNYTVDPRAYELYTQGRHEWNKRSAPGMIDAQRLFRYAIEADPGFALAYVGLADTLLTNQPAQAEAAAAIDKALELDPTLGEAHASRGFYLMFYEWNWTESERALKRAVELNPNYATAHHWYATLLAIQGKTDEARVELEKALELNPISHNFLADLGQLYYFSGDYTQAESYCRKALELYPDFSFGHEYLYYIYLKTGQYEQAVVEMAKAQEINGRFGHGGSGSRDILGEDTEIFRKSGIRGYFEYKYPSVPTSPETVYMYAIKHAIVGENDKALDCLERSANSRFFLSVFVKANPVFDGLRSEPRYKDILRKMGLPS